MSPKRDLSVAEMVKKYKERFFSDRRPDLRRRIRTENPNVFENNLSNLRKLDRYLRKEFVTKPLLRNNASLNTVSGAHSATGVFSPFAEITPTRLYPLKKGIWDPPPDFSFSPNYEEAHRKKREDYEPADNVQFPQVPFNWHNWSPYQLKIRLEVRVVLGGRNLGFIDDRKGYYNGKANILVEPYHGGIRDGCFTLPPDCARSGEETTIEARARILDQNDASKNEYVILKSWTYDAEKKEWFHEPKAFTEDLSSSNERMSSWESLKKALAEIGGYLTDIEVEKRRSDETFEKIPVQGIMMLAGAKTMQAAAKIYVPDEYEAFLLTQASVNEAYTLTWQGINYMVRKVDEIYDAYVVSYRIAKLVKPPLEIYPAWVLG